MQFRVVQRQQHLPSMIPTTAKQQQQQQQQMHLYSELKEAGYHWPEGPQEKRSSRVGLRDRVLRPLSVPCGLQGKRAS